MSCGTLDAGLTSTTSVTGLLPCLVLLSNNLLLAVSVIPPVRTPKIRRSRVWALSRSLAATKKIDVSFSSSGYLDVSVHRVPSACLCIQHTVTGCASRVPPFGDPRIIAHVQLPAAFRSLSRPSSALSAKASALRPFLLNLRSALCGTASFSSLL